MKGRFLLFTFHQYYPQGGCSDLEGSYDTLEEAQKAAKTPYADWYNIYDCEERQEIESGSCKETKS